MNFESLFDQSEALDILIDQSEVCDVLQAICFKGFALPIWNLEWTALGWVGGGWCPTPF